MTRRAGGNSTDTVALFPFLAVLLCTMGSLIVLLIVVARAARERRFEAPPVAAPTVGAAQIAERRDELTWEIEHLTASRRKTAEQLAEQRAALSHLEEHTQRLRDESAELDVARQMLVHRDELDDTARARLRDELAALRARAAKTEADVAVARAAGRRRPSFAVIPYDGENGTRRRPIYIECRGDSVIIQPEGIVFTEGDFAGSLGASNPLAACLRATAEHYARSGNLQPGEQPYPLLLVRPDGIGAYYVARAAMTTWDSDFGYELVDADWPLEFQPADPQLQMLLARTQDEARRRQVLIARAAPRLQTGEVPSFQMVDRSGEGGSGYRGSSSGGGGLGDRYADATSGGSAFVPGGNGSNQFGAGTNGAYGGGANTTGGLGGGPGLGAGGAPGAPQGTLGGTGTGMPGTPGMSARPGLGAGGGNGTPGGAPPNGDGPQLFASGETGNLNGGAAGGAFGSPDGGGANAAGGAPGDSSNGATGGSADGASSGSGGPAGGANGSNAGGSPAVGDPSAMQAGASPSIHFGDAPQSSAAPQQSDARRRPDSLAGKRGKDWGLPASAQRSTGITRPVQIYCAGDRLTVLSDRGAPDRQITLGPRTEDSVDELVSTVWGQIESWGIAGSGMYWKPVLSVHVAPDGVGRFEDLQALMAGSGLEVTGKPITAAPPTARRP